MCASAAACFTRLCRWVEACGCKSHQASRDVWRCEVIGCPDHRALEQLSDWCCPAYELDSFLTSPTSPLACCPCRSLCHCHFVTLLCSLFPVPCSDGFPYLSKKATITCHLPLKNTLQRPARTLVLDGNVFFFFLQKNMIGDIGGTHLSLNVAHSYLLLTLPCSDGDGLL